MERITNITPGYDKRDPDPSKNHGIHGCDLRMVLKGKLGAVQFVLYTDWFPKSVDKEKLSFGLYPIPVDVGYHSPVPQYEGQTRIGEHRITDIFENIQLTTDLIGTGVKTPEIEKVPEQDLPICEYIGCPCYYDGSGLATIKVFDILLNEGSDGVWKHLEEYYINVFGKLE